MNDQELLQELLVEHPAAKEAIRHVHSQLRGTDSWTAVLGTLIAMQRAIHEKRESAKSMVKQREGLGPRIGNGHGRISSFRHIPDVMLRKLCQIAEIPHYTSATPEQLDEMEKRHGL